MKILKNPASPDKSGQGISSATFHRMQRDLARGGKCKEILLVTFTRYTPTCRQAGLPLEGRRSSNGVYKFFRENQSSGNLLFLPKASAFSSLVFTSRIDTSQVFYQCYCLLSRQVISRVALWDNLQPCIIFAIYE